MKRLTTNKPVEEMSMYELAHNSCYIDENLNARYRDFETDIDTRELTRKLMVAFGQWKTCEECGLEADNEMIDDDIFDDTMLDYLGNYPTTITGLIALFYRSLWAMADLRERLKHYEDLEEQGLLLKLPVPLGSEVYCVYADDCGNQPCSDNCYECENAYWKIQKVKFNTRMIDDFGVLIFQTLEEAEAMLKELENE